MQFSLSMFGENFTARAGIVHLMDDLGAALERDPSMLMLGGGNPSHIPEVQAVFRARMQEILAEQGAFERMIGNYASPAGDAAFAEALAGLLEREFGWAVGSENIALTNGSQTAFFFLFNMFAGRCNDGARRKILFPVTPEYIGYADTGLTDDFFAVAMPAIEELDDNLFKYHVNFDALRVGENVGAVCVSRPTNPTGNVLTADELRRLAGMAEERGIPLIIDNAYGVPFPGIVFTEADSIWGPNTILCMSLSKLGLPGARTGIVIGPPEVARQVARMNGVLSLAPGNFGAALARDLIRSGEILRMSREVIQPFYLRKQKRAVAHLRSELAGLDFRIHKPEGALFLWLWFPGLPITASELYERLRGRGVIVVPGHYFFPGIADPGRHARECLRVTYAQDDDVVERGLTVLAEEVRKAFAH